MQQSAVMDHWMSSSSVGPEVRQWPQVSLTSSTKQKLLRPSPESSQGRNPLRPALGTNSEASARMDLRRRPDLATFRFHGELQKKKTPVSCTRTIFWESWIVSLALENTPQVNVIPSKDPIFRSLSLEQSVPLTKMMTLLPSCMAARFSLLNTHSPVARSPN